MNQPVIQVEDLSKRFIIGHQKAERYTALRDVITNNVKSLLRKTRDLTKGNYSVEGEVEEEFWALRNVDFDIHAGDRVGIVGRNGAGKSTLLKVLSRITEPTSGRVSIRGRVASLLEVGTGFHPELTGRENIFLNGAILGMSRAEIRRKFDEIVDFAEVEKFLDTPVKRYSSGMYVRLAFAVAAHLEPEILIVDEVLAVGDAQFQKKCLGKMQDVSVNQGRTVLFVSHNMLAIKSLCTTGILLEKGKIEASGPIEDIIFKYSSFAAQNLSSFIEIQKASHDFTIESISISSNGINGSFNIEEDLVIDIRTSGCKDYESINLNIFFKTSDDSVVFATCTNAEKFTKGKYIFSCVIPANTLNDIVYTLDLMVVEKGPKILHHLKNIISIEGMEQKRDGAWLGKFPGLLRPLNYPWTKRKINEQV